MSPGAGPSPRLFVALLLAACALLIAAVAAFNALLDPYGTIRGDEGASAIWSDRTVKVDLVTALATPPETIVLGSSRALKVEPSYVARLSGRPAFNAAVSGGKPVDAYVFTRLLHDRFPTTRQTYLWLLDQESFAPEPISPIVVNDEALCCYLPRQERMRARLTDLSWLLSWRTLQTSWRTWRHERAERERAAQRRRHASTGAVQDEARLIEFLPDGFRRHDVNDMRAARGVPLSKRIAATEGIFTKRYRSHFPSLVPMQKTWFERTLGQMNDWGSTPVLVLSPVHPRLLATLRPLGWERRHHEVLHYLAGLHARYRFVLLDLSDISSFGGSPRLFFDGVHMKVPNYRRLLDSVYEDEQAAESLGSAG